MKNPFRTLTKFERTLWILASARDISSLPMVFCFVMFLANDLYGFVNWRRMQRKQSGNKSGFSV